MFFGNQVTCDYWDYVWLNEGFASYLEYVIADKVNGHSHKLIVWAASYVITSRKHIHSSYQTGGFWIILW